MRWSSVVGVVLVACVGFVCGGCAAGGSLVGSWRGEDGRGGEVVLTFREDATGSWESGGSGRSTRTGLGWELDEGVRPARLDLHGFDGGPMAGAAMYGILEWVDGGKGFRLDLEPGREGDDSRRPVEFTSDAMVFERVEGGGG